MRNLHINVFYFEILNIIIILQYIRENFAGYWKQPLYSYLFQLLWCSLPLISLMNSSFVVLLPIILVLLCFQAAFSANSIKTNHINHGKNWSIALSIVSALRFLSGCGFCISLWLQAENSSHGLFACFAIWALSSSLSLIGDSAPQAKRAGVKMFAAIFNYFIIL